MKRLFLVIALTLGLHTAATAATVVPPSDVQEKVRPILDLCRQAKATHSGRQNTMFLETERLTGKLFQDKAKSSDEALVVLLNFYVGEATGQDVLHHITVRGKRMLPLLLKYRDAHVILPKGNYASILLPADVRKEGFDDAIKSIKAGKTLGED
jgi:hypothetical protein